MVNVLTGLRERTFRPAGWISLAIAGGLLGWITVHGWGPLVMAFIGLLVLLMIPLQGLFILFFGAAMMTRIVWHVGGIAIRPDQVLLIPLAIRVLLPRKSIVGGIPTSIVIIMLLTVGWWATGLVSSLTLSSSPGHSLRDVAWIFLSLFSGFIVYVAVKKHLVGLVQLLDIFRWSLMAAVCYGLLAYALHASLHTTFGVQLNPITNHYEIYGPSWEANIFGSVAALSLFLWWPSNDVEKAWWKYIGVTLSAVGVILCVTRGVWFAVAFVLLLLVLTKRIRVPAIFGIAALVPFVFSPLLSRQIAHVSGGSIDLSARLNTASAVVSQWAHGGFLHNLLGFGVNTWGLTHVLVVGSGSTAPQWLGGQVFQTLYDTGAIGLALLTASVSVLTWQLWGLRNEVWAVRFVGAILAIIISYEDTTALWFSFTWIIGILGVLVIEEQRSGPLGTTPDGTEGGDFRGDR